MSDERVSAIVLAGGASRRFGSDKLAARLGDRPLLEHVLDALEAVTSDITVVVGPGDERVLPAGVRTAHDPRPHEGPLAGLVTGLEAIPAGSAIVLVVAGDMPTVRPAVLRLLVDAVAAGAPAAVLHDGVAPRPLPAAYARESVRTAAARLIDAGERRLRALPDALAATAIPAAVWQGLDPAAATLHDVDRPEDLPVRDRPTH